MLLRDNSVEKWYVLFLLWAVVGIECDLRCPPAASEDKCKEAHSGGDEYFFKINEEIDLQIIYGPKYFQLVCPENVTLENEFLPSFDKLETFSSVILSKCPLPSRSYRETLYSLNVSVGSFLELFPLRGDSILKANLFESLNISSLKIAGDEAASTMAEPNFLQPLPELADLRLTRVTLDAAVVLHLPRTLSLLKLKNTGVDRLPPEAFARLDRLHSLFVDEERLASLDLSAAPHLNETEIRAPIDGLTLGPGLESLWLIGARDVVLRGNCTSLRVVHVQDGGAALPDSWLSECAVRQVHVSGAGAGSAAGEWRGASTLQDLNLRYCGLRDLPADWLKDTDNLESLDLSYNHLEHLPRDLFSHTRRLRRLNLSKNRLKREAAAALGSLHKLRWLSLDYNHLGDLCGSSNEYVVQDVSPLRSLLMLESLSLRGTGATMLCLDWRTELRLQELDLRNNNITDLRYADTQWPGGVHLAVDMRGSKVSSLVYSADNYATVLKTAPAAPDKLDADWALYCDCTQYWVARALRERPQHAPALQTAQCESGAPLAERPLRSFTCPLPPDRCPPGCACAASPVHTELRCAGAGLHALPQAVEPLRGAGLPPVTELRVPGNNITVLRPQDLALIVNVTILDLSNNSISTIDAKTVAALFPEQRRVSLAGNPLRCDCSALALLRAVAERPGRVDELARCADGTSLLAAAERAAAACGPSPVWPAAAAVALLLLLPAALLAGVLARPAVRARLKLFLFERGLCLRWLLRADADEDGARPYDAFVSYSHLDAQFAAELEARLESAGRRLCLHERDWTPGEWIPTQIARSVRDARRTIVLVSEHFLRSEWARAELREAYGAALGEARPRLLVVLLPGCAPDSAANAAPELRAYLAAVTYLRWDDPRFWSRLHMALPPRASVASPPRELHHKPTAAAA